MNINEYIKEIGIGLTCTAIGGIIGYYWKFIKPIIINIFQRVPKISGKWLAYDDESKNEQSGSCIIGQWGNQIKITMTLTKSRKGKPINREFILKGTLISNHLIMKFEEDAGRGFINGAAVFKLDGNLKTLSGLVTFYEPDQGKVVSLTRILCKV